METQENGNRVAQRDYYEFHSLQHLSLTQINQLGVLICPVCELRLVQKEERNECRQCVQKRKTDEMWNRVAVVAVVLGLLTWIGCLIAWGLGLEGRKAVEVGGVIALFLLAALYYLNLRISVWIDIAATKEIADRRHMTAILTCLAPGILILAAAKHLPESVLGWGWGVGFLMLMFTALLLRKKPGGKHSPVAFQKDATQ